MGTRNQQRFIDKSSLPFVVRITTTTLTLVASPQAVLSGVISTTRDFYGFVIRSTGTGAFTWVLTSGGEALSAAGLDGVTTATAGIGSEIVRNLGDSGRLVPVFCPKDGQISIAFSTALAGPITAEIEIVGQTILG